MAHLRTRSEEGGVEGPKSLLALARRPSFLQRVNANLNKTAFAKGGIDVTNPLLLRGLMAGG